MNDFSSCLLTTWVFVRLLERSSRASVCSSRFTDRTMEPNSTMDEKDASVQAPSDSSPERGADLADGSLINDAALMRKIDVRLLPGVTLPYLMSFLDRSNVANARVEGLTKDTYMSEVSI